MVPDSRSLKFKEIPSGVRQPAPALLRMASQPMAQWRTGDHHPQSGWYVPARSGLRTGQRSRGQISLPFRAYTSLHLTPGHEISVLTAGSIGVIGDITVSRTRERKVGGSGNHRPLDVGSQQVQGCKVGLLVVHGKNTCERPGDFSSLGLPAHLRWRRANYLR